MRSGAMVRSSRSSTIERAAGASLEVTTVRVLIGTRYPPIQTSRSEALRSPTGRPSRSNATALMWSCGPGARRSGTSCSCASARTPAAASSNRATRRVMPHPNLDTASPQSAVFSRESQSTVSVGNPSRQCQSTATGTTIGDCRLRLTTATDDCRLPTVDCLYPSLRSATVGSTRAARQAGSAHASTTDIAITAAAPA